MVSAGPNFSQVLFFLGSSFLGSRRCEAHGPPLSRHAATLMIGQNRFEYVYSKKRIDQPNSWHARGCFVIFVEPFK